MGVLLDACIRGSDSNARLVWAAETFLETQGIGQWMDLPVWVSDRESPDLATIDVHRAVAAGLTFRTIDATVADTLAWDRTRPADHTWGAGLTAEREAAALAAMATG
jgi:2'-hydroxyisoflavone reductase